MTCIGRFNSLQVARSSSSDFSGLIVIWFQEKFAFPIDPEVVTQLLAIDWEAHAADIDYCASHAEPFAAISCASFARFLCSRYNPLRPCLLWAGS